MAGGSLSANGVWLYGEDDQRDTFSALLNIGGASVNDAIGTDRARLAALESTGLLGGVTAGAVVAATDWTVTGNARKKNGLAFVDLLFTLTGAPITIQSNGNITDTTLGTFTAGWVPAGGMAYPAVSRDGRVSAFTLSATFIQIRWTTVGGSIATGDVLQLTAVYPLA